MFITGFLFDLILVRTSKFTLDERFLLVTFFLVVPLNISRVLMITIPYTICYFLFFFAWYLKPINKILSYFLFFISFATNSLLVFHLLPISYYYFIENKENISFKRILKYLKNNLIFISLPIFYYLLKIIYFKPFGFFEGYNSNFNVFSLFISPAIQFFKLFDNNISSLGLIITLFIGINLILKSNKNLLQNGINQQNKKFFIYLSLISVIVACFPYWILGHTPIFFDWKSRHQLLMPLGISFALFTFSIYVHKSNLRLVISIILSICMSMNLNAYYSLAVNWHKQESLIKLISQDNKIRNSDFLIFDDATNGNPWGRPMNFYEWNGLLNRAFSDQKRLGVDRNQTWESEGKYINQILSSPLCKEIYKLKNFNLNDDLKQTVVEISELKNTNQKNNLKSKFLNKIKGKLFASYQLKSYEVEPMIPFELIENNSKDICDF
jgi:hypothetical protein